MCTFSVSLSGTDQVLMLYPVYLSKPVWHDTNLAFQKGKNMNIAGPLAPLAAHSAKCTHMTAVIDLSVTDLHLS